MFQCRETPLVWMVLGHRAGLSWSQHDGLYTASVASLPGCSARGQSRTEALAALAWEVARAEGCPPAHETECRRSVN